MMKAATRYTFIEEQQHVASMLRTVAAEREYLYARDYDHRLPEQPAPAVVIFNLSEGSHT